MKRVLLLLLLVLPHCGGGDAAKFIPKKCEPKGDLIELRTKDLKYNTDCLAVDEGSSFEVTLRNSDVDEHNFSIYKKQGGEVLRKGEIFAKKNEKVSYEFKGLDTGAFYFQCDIHPEMNGSFNVKASK